MTSGNEGTWVVSGGASGVGAALVQRLVGAGREVIVLDRAAPSPDAVAVAGVQWIPCDLAVQDSIDAALARVPAQIAGLANVAGIARAASPATVVAVNFLALRHLVRALTPRLRAGAGIVNVSSVAGRDWRARLDRIAPLLDTRDMAEGLAWCEREVASYGKDPYTFSKRCVTAFTLREAAVHARTSTRINCVSPGGIHTQLTPDFEALMGKAQADWSNEHTERAAVPDEIAEGVAWLLTGPCRWVNGVDLPVDKGYTAGLDSGWIDFAQSPVMRARQPRG